MSQPDTKAIESALAEDWHTLTERTRAAIEQLAALAGYHLIAVRDYVQLNDDRDTLLTQIVADHKDLLDRLAET